MVEYVRGKFVCQKSVEISTGKVNESHFENRTSTYANFRPTVPSLLVTINFPLKNPLQKILGVLVFPTNYDVDDVRYPTQTLHVPQVRTL